MWVIGLLVEWVGSVVLKAENKTSQDWLCPLEIEAAHKPTAFFFSEPKPTVTGHKITENNPSIVVLLMTLHRNRKLGKYEEEEQIFF